jgi:hypothetical protein
MRLDPRVVRCAPCPGPCQEELNHRTDCGSGSKCGCRLPCNRAARGPSRSRSRASARGARGAPARRSPRTRRCVGTSAILRASFPGPAIGDHPASPDDRAGLRPHAFTQTQGPGLRHAGACFRGKAQPPGPRSAARPRPVDPRERRCRRRSARSDGGTRPKRLRRVTTRSQRDASRPARRASSCRGLERC